MKVELKQRERAGMQFIGSVQAFAGKTLQATAAAEYAAEVPEPPAALDERRSSVYDVLSDSGAWAFDRLLTRWVAEEIYVRCLPAIETVRPEAEDWLDVTEPSGTLTLQPDVVPPAYWEHGFHLTPGGWDGHDLMGPAVANLVVDYVFAPGGVGAVRTGANADDQRTLVAREAPSDSYERIVDFGAGSGRYTLALRDVYPDARITGVDLSKALLRHAHALSAQNDSDIDWLQADVENTGLESESVDLVTFYTLMHEVPAESNRKILAEAFRILQPGGHLVIGEIAPYEKQSAFTTVVLDWETENRGEPYWREVLALDLPAELRDAGFTEVEAYGVGGSVYPWVTRAVKPTV